MHDLIDQQDEERAYSLRRTIHKRLNVVLLGFVGAAFIYIALKIWQTKLAIDSPLLPDYLVAKMNASALNFSGFLLIGTILSIYFRRREKYSISNNVILWSAFIGILLKDTVHFYEWFYGIL